MVLFMLYIMDCNKKTGAINPIKGNNGPGFAIAAG